MRSHRRRLSWLLPCVVVGVIAGGLLVFMPSHSGLREIERMTGMRFPRPVPGFAQTDSSEPPIVAAERIQAHFTIPVNSVPSFVAQHGLTEDASPVPLSTTSGEDVRQAALSFFVMRPFLPERFQAVTELGNRRYAEGICPGNHAWCYRVMVDAGNGQVWVQLDYQP